MFDFLKAGAALSALLLSLSASAEIAVFAPPGINPEFVGKVSSAHVNIQDLASLERNLKAVTNSPTKVDLDFGPVLNRAKHPSHIKTSYHWGNKQHRKSLKPLANNKLRSIPSDAEIRRILQPYMGLMQRYQAQIATVFVADEPYLHGIPKVDLERAAKTIRSLFQEHQIHEVKLGVIFASGMANARFAKMLDKEAARYVKNIDQHRRILLGKTKAKTATSAEREWLQHIKTSRLTTYDNAGNLYVGGGLPKGYDLYGFDFYLSTVLQDALYEDMIPALKKHVQHGECDFGDIRKMSQLRAQLSFYQDGPIVQAAANEKTASQDPPRDQDRAVLDQLYQCRMTAATHILRQEIAKIGGHGKIILISESSNNGVLEFDARQNIESAQPQLLVEARVLDEVKRAIAFYEQEKSKGDIAALEFFTFDNTFDKSIQLSIGGFADMKPVKALIFETSQKIMCSNGSVPPATCN